MKTTKVYTTNELITGCKANNRQMQELLYRQTSAKMFAICMRYAKDSMDAEDVLQLGFIKIFNKITEYRGDGAFEGWMRRIMVNTAIENYRKNLKMQQNMVLMDDLVAHAGEAPAYNDLGVQDLLKLIQKLADGYRIVFNMYAIEGYSHREIAQALGISEGASKSQLSRARAILQKEIIKMEGLGYEQHVG